MGHSDKPSDGGTTGVRGCGGNLMVASAKPKTSFWSRNFEAVMSMIAAFRASKAVVDKQH